MKQFILPALLTASLPALADTSSPERLCRDSSLTEHRQLLNEVKLAELENPAIKGTAWSTSFSQLFITAPYRHQKEPFVLQNGNGAFLPEFKVESYLRLSPRTTVWGTAAYMNGRKKGISWNSTADYNLLYPYVLADTLGGKTTNERYSFSGGYATRLHKFLIGGELRFRAEHEYRTTDPRMRGIVSDLFLNLGGGYHLPGYYIGARVEGNVYRQSNSVTFYREAGSIPEYQMTGLGTYYKRFSGNQSEISYKGSGLKLSAELVPDHAQGWFGRLAVAQYAWKRINVDFNSLPISTLYNKTLDLKAGWRRQDGNPVAVFAGWSFARRSGDEHIAGTAASNVYPQIATLTMYKKNTSCLYIGGLIGRKHVSLSAQAGYRTTRERYEYPERLMNTDRYYGELKGQWFFHTSRKWLWEWTVKGLYSGCSHSEIVMPYVDMDPAFTRMINYTYDNARASYTALQTGIRADYAITGRYGLYAALNGGTVLCKENNNNEITIQLTIGITF